MFPVPDSPRGWLWQHVPGRDGAVLSVSGYQRHIGDGVWRFAQSTDNAGSWRTTDVRLPLGDVWIYHYTEDYLDTVGPDHRLAIAMTNEHQDGPRYLWELWLTDDERAFHRVPLTRFPKDLGGIAFATDGALLLGEATGHRIWRLPPGGTDIEPVPGAPRLAEPGGWFTLFTSGGVIVARTGDRSLATSLDGAAWTPATPGGA